MRRKIGANRKHIHMKVMFHLTLPKIGTADKDNQ